MGEIGVKQGHLFSCVLEDVDVCVHFTQYFNDCYLEFTSMYTLKMHCKLLQKLENSLAFVPKCPSNAIF